MLTKKIRYKQQLSSLGSLSRGVVHDFNNSLFVISGSIELIALMNKDEKLYCHINTIRKAVSDASNMTEKLLLFSRKDGVAYSVINAHVIIDDAIAIATSSIASAMKISKDFQASDVNIKCDVSEMRKVLINVIRNVCQALDSKNSIIQVCTYNYDNTMGEFDFEGSLFPDKSIVISIFYNSSGIREEIKKCISESWKRSEGTELELSAAYSVIKEHRGNISVHSASNSNSGTQLKIYLPISEYPVIKT